MAKSLRILIDSNFTTTEPNELTFSQLDQNFIDLSSKGGDGFIQLSDGSGNPSFSSGFKWDKSNNRLEIIGGGSTATTNNLTITDSSSNSLIEIRDDGTINMTTTKGAIAVPRVDNTQRATISSLLTGMLIYNTQESEFQGYNGATWDSIGSATATGTTGAVLFTDGNESILSDGANFNWDDTNNLLFIKGSTTNTTEVLRIVNSASNEIASFENGGLIRFNENLSNGVIYFGTGGGRITTPASGNSSLAQVNFFNCGLTNSLACNDQIISHVKNLNIGTALTSAGADHMLSMALGGTVPTTLTSDTFVMYAADYSGVGTTSPFFKTEDGVVINVRDAITEFVYLEYNPNIITVGHFIVNGTKNSLIFDWVDTTQIVSIQVDYRNGGSTTYITGDTLTAPGSATNVIIYLSGLSASAKTEIRVSVIFAAAWVDRAFVTASFA